MCGVEVFCPGCYDCMMADDVFFEEKGSAFEVSCYLDEFLSGDVSKDGSLGVF